MISLLSQKYERQGALPASCFQVRPSVKDIENLTALYYKTLRAKLAKRYWQSKNSTVTECDIFG